MLLSPYSVFAEESEPAAAAAAFVAEEETVDSDPAYAVILLSGDTNTTAEGFQYEHINGELRITEYSGSDTDVTVPASIDGYNVLEIGASAFKEKTGLLSISIPDITEITIPAGLESVGTNFFTPKYAPFSEANNLRKVTFASGMATIPEWIFDSCKNLESVTIPNTVKTVEQSAFNGCDNLKSVTFQGTEEDWKKITIKEYNDPLLQAAVTFTVKQDPAADTMTFKIPNSQFGAGVVDTIKSNLTEDENAADTGKFDAIPGANATV